MNGNKTILKLAIIGFIMGAFIGNGITAAFASSADGFVIVAPQLSEEYGYVTAIILQTVVSGLLGIITFAGTVVYYSERFSIAAATLIHMSLSMVTMALVSNFLWWTDRTLEGTLLFLLFIFMIYVLIWVSITVSYSIQIRQINEALEKRRSGKE